MGDNRQSLCGAAVNDDHISMGVFMQSGKRLSQLAIAGVAVAALVTGCGSSSGGSPNAATSAKVDSGKDTLTPQALLAGSVDKTLAAKNAKISLNVKTSAAGKSIDITGDGIIDFVDKKLSMTLNLPSEAGIGGAIEERLIDKTVYVKLPSSLTSVTGGKAWVKVDASSGGTGLDSATQNPTDLLATLRNVSKSITKVGTEDIRGVKTTHYRAEVDLTKAINASASKQQLSAEQLAQLKKVLGSSTVPEDVYLDDDGLPRRFAVVITPATGSTGTAEVGKVTFSMDFYDYGKTDTSSIAAPPASEVGSLPTGATGLSG
jgi:hypothetical protein